MERRTDVLKSEENWCSGARPRSSRWSRESDISTLDSSTPTPSWSRWTDKHYNETEKALQRVGKREMNGGRELTSSGVSFFTEIFSTEMCRWRRETTRTAFALWFRSRSRVVRSTTISARQHGTGSSAPWWTPAPSSSGSYHSCMTLMLVVIVLIDMHCQPHNILGHSLNKLKCQNIYRVVF